MALWGGFDVGQTASIQRSFGAAEVEQFAELTGDKNPVHLSEEHAAQTRFGARIVHGMLVSSLFSTLLGTVLPGEGAVYLGQTLKFRAPVYLGETVVARVEIVAVREDKPIATLRTVATKSPGDEVVVEGEAVMLLPAGARPKTNGKEDS